jgi:hypothetical protein
VNRNPIADLILEPKDPELEEQELHDRVKQKVAAWQESEEGISPTQAPQKGLGEMFQTNITEISKEDLAKRSSISTSKANLDPTWDRVNAVLRKKSCAFFAQDVLQGPTEQPYDGKFLIGEHHEEWDQLVQNHDRIVVLAPRDHGKTFYFDFAYPIWKVVHDPGGIGFIFSATKEQAVRILADIKEEIESNPKLNWLVPKKKENWSSTHIRLSNGHHIYARGFGTKVRGAHPSWIVVDDGLNDETAYSELVRNKQKDYFYTAITNMIIPGGQIIVVGTPFHQEDLYADLQRNPEYKFRQYQALNEKSGKALWPERYDKERLERRKKEIGVVRFTREFQCSPISDDMSLFPGHLFRGEPTEQFRVRLGENRDYWNQLGIQSVFMGVDFAMSSTVQADFTVVWTMGTDKERNRWIMDIRKEKGLGFQQQLSLINEVAQLYQPGLVYLEANQMQRIFGDELIRKTDLPIKQFVTGVQKNSLDKGVPSLRVLLENGKFRIPRGDAHSVEMTNEWINEMRNFTWHDGKLQGVGSHDDMVMACWICDQAVRQGAFSFSFDGDEADTSGTQSPMIQSQPNSEGEGEKDPDTGKASGNLVGNVGSPIMGSPIVAQAGF